MLSSLLWMSLTGCFLFGNDGSDSPLMFGDDDPTESGTDPGPPPDTTMRESRTQILAAFRYDAATGLPGAWTDADGDEGISAIQVVVGDDQYTGASGTACGVLIPISPDGARLITDLEPSSSGG